MLLPLPAVRLRTQSHHSHVDSAGLIGTGHQPTQEYRNEVPQHHHRDLLSSRAVWRSSVLSNQYGCGCGKFGTKRPQVQILSPRPVPQVSDLRECHILRAVSHSHAHATYTSREQKGTRGNPRESRGQLRQAEEHPASPHDLADPAARQGPSGHSDPPSATKRPHGRNARRPGSSSDPEVRQARHARDPREQPKRGRSRRAWRPSVLQISAFR
jgi:hypothetical protein